MDRQTDHEKLEALRLTARMMYELSLEVVRKPVGSSPEPEPSGTGKVVAMKERSA